MTGWRPRPELNRGTRFCRPLRNHSATWPFGSADQALCAQRIGCPAIQDRQVGSNAADARAHALRRPRRCRYRVRTPLTCPRIPPMLDFAAARRMMVDGQVRTSDVTDLRLIAAMLSVPRERFVPKAAAELAYLDTDL